MLNFLFPKTVVLIEPFMKLLISSQNEPKITRDVRKFESCFGHLKSTVKQAPLLER